MRSWTPKKLEELQQLRKSGLTYGQIADKLGFPRSVCQRVGKSGKIPMCRAEYLATRKEVEDSKDERDNYALASDELLARLRTHHKDGMGIYNAVK